MWSKDMKKLIILLLCLSCSCAWSQTRPSILDIRPLEGVSKLAFTAKIASGTLAVVNNFWVAGDSGGGT
jgi:hypothetical protein